MNSIDLSPFYRTSIGFDRMGPLIANAFKAETLTPGYPTYDIESLSGKEYAITLAVAGFTEDDIDITVESGLLTIRGERTAGKNKKYLYQGIANDRFERKFDLADFVKVTKADLHNGLLKICLVREIPLKLKPKSIAINQRSRTANSTKSTWPKLGSLEAA